MLSFIIFMTGDIHLELTGATYVHQEREEKQISK